MPFANLIGSYVVDMENTAHLQAGAFHEKFIMKPGYDEAILAFVKRNQNLLDAIKIELTQTELKIQTDAGEENLPILSIIETPSHTDITVSWPDVSSNDPLPFRLMTLAPNVLRFQNPTLDFDRIAFKKAVPTT